MDALLFIFGIPFSFFFLILSYWKEDRNFNIYGSMSLLIMAGCLITGIQTTSQGFQSIVVTDSIGTVLTNNTVTFNKIENVANLYECIGVALFMVLFTAIQYLYFTIVYNEERANNGL